MMIVLIRFLVPSIEAILKQRISCTVRTYKNTIVEFNPPNLDRREKFWDGFSIWLRVERRTRWWDLSRGEVSVRMIN